MPEPGSELKILYITHFEIKMDLSIELKQDILNLFLDALYESGIYKDYHIIGLCDFPKQSLLDAIKSKYFLFITPTVLFQHYIPSVVDAVVEDSLEFPPAVELCLE